MRLFWLFLVLSLMIVPATGWTIEVGDEIELKATNPRGVPLHREARSSHW